MEKRSTFASRMPLAAKNLFVAGFGEFVGTFMFIYLALGGVNAVNTSGPKDQILASNPAQLFYICLCFGLALMVTVFIFFRITGGQFNPAVTLGLVLVGAVDPIRGVVIFVAQMLGSMSASAVLSTLMPGALDVTTTLRSDVNLARGVFLEAFCTSILVLAVLFMAVEKHRATFMAPLCIGFALFIAELVSIPYTGGSINPARSFGPCVATRSFPSEHWIYWVGPLFGGVMAATFYKIMKFLEYETCNPGQDGAGDASFMPESTQNGILPH